MIDPLVKDALKTKKMSIMGMIAMKKGLKTTPLLPIDERTESGLTIHPKTPVLLDQNDQKVAESSELCPSLILPVLPKTEKKESAALAVLPKKPAIDTEKSKVARLESPANVLPDPIEKTKKKKSAALFVPISYDIPDIDMEESNTLSESCPSIVPVVPELPATTEVKKEDF